MIHYDLKPANIMLSSRQHVLLSDFGLAKQSAGSSLGEATLSDVTAPQRSTHPSVTAGGGGEVDGESGVSVDQGEGVSLSCEGAGTYWYLPPECFPAADAAAHRDQPLIVTTKVDVWSAGVVLYEMLYGFRPYAHELSPAQIWRDRHEVWNQNVTYASVNNVTKAPISAQARRCVYACFCASVRAGAARILRACCGLHVGIERVLCRTLRCPRAHTSALSRGLL